jgi:aromatic-L-amino-acid decarboxylase
MEKREHRLELDPEEMRRFGYQVIDEIVAHWTQVGERPVMHLESRPNLEARLRTPLPENPAPLDELLAQLRRDVWSNIGNVIHPRFFAFIPSPANFVSVLADALTAAYNPFAGNWLEGAGPAQIELVTIDWLRQLIGLPETAGGLFLSGGSVANLTALATAIRQRVPDQLDQATVYFSDQTHASVERALKALGVPEERRRRLPADGDFRLPLDLLRQAIENDRRAGRLPFCVIANAGTTNTGAVDPLEALADLCQEEQLWLHADGAYGAAAALSPRGKRLLRGLERVDSLSLDPHKWLFQPFEIGCLLLRDANLLRQTWAYTPEYLKDTALSLEEVNFYDYGLQLTRSFRALKLWLSLKTFGAGAFRAAIEHGFHLSELAARIVSESSSLELITPASMGILSFRYQRPGMSDAEIDTVNRDLVQMMIKDGFAFANSTTLRGRVVIRLCTINPRTTEKDIVDTLHWIETLGEEWKG